MSEIRKILVPTDFSDNSLQALGYAQDLATGFGAEIVLAHVLEPPIYPAMTFGAGAASLPALQDELRQTVSQHLDRLVEEQAQKGAAMRGVLREGSPFHEIIALAEEEQADMIVIATHGHSGLAHLLLGSTTEKVVRKAPCPVLTIRVEGDDATA